jgi:hypothetical protein
MNQPPPRRSLRKTLAILSAGVGGLVLVLWGVLLVLSWGRWRAMDREVARLVAEASSRNGPRPVVWGEATPGNAWDDYVLGLEDLLTTPIQTPGNLRAFAGRAGTADRAQVERELAAHGKALDHLVRGAHRTEARLLFKWDAESILPYGGEGLLRKLGELSICRIRFLREKGDPGAALGALLETAQFARDAASNSSSEYEWEGLGVLDLVLSELEDLVLSHRLKDADLEALEPALQTLDTSLARDGGALLNDVAGFGCFLKREDPYLEADGTYIKRRPLSPGWQHAFSMALFKTDAFNRWRDAAMTHAAGGAWGWDEARKVYAQNAALLERPPENLAVNRLTAPSLETIRQREARLALLRMAVQFLRTGKAEPLPDPFGALVDPATVPAVGTRGGARTTVPLRVRSDLRTLRAWSVGPNGIDDDGNSADRPRNTTGSTTIIGPALNAADDIAIWVER